MKRRIHIVMNVSAAALLTFSALAQDTTNSTADRPEYSLGHTSGARRLGRLNEAAKASDLIGMTVKNNEGEKLGKVDDLVVDVESGRIVLVILSSGGFLGLGDTLTALPPGALHCDVAQKTVRLDSTKEKLQQCPKIELSKLGECCDSNHLAAVYQHYGEDRELNYIQVGNLPPDGQHDTSTAPLTVSTGEADSAQRHGSSTAQCLIPSARLAQLQRASKLMGTSVNNLQDEKLGKVENLLVDLPAGRVVAIVVSSGGFLGMGDELSAVPPTALRFTPDHATLQLDTTKDLLSSAPHFKNNHWPDFAQPVYADGVYRAYQVTPYFTTNVFVDGDNTALNVRDRGGRNLTPLDQGNSQSDLDITAQIRKEIMAGKMSINAQNVKVITIDGRVTLRGPVNTNEEKRQIGDIADRIAHHENVDNQLDVPLTTTSNN